MRSRSVYSLVLGLAVCLFVAEPCQAQLLKNRLSRGKESKGAEPKPGRKPFDNPAEPEPTEPEPIEDGPVSPLENKVREAQDAYEEDRFEDCIALTTEVLNAEPRHAVARYHRASALIDLGRQTGEAKQIRAGVADAREALSVAGNQHLIFHVPYFYGLTSLAEIENRKSHAELAVSIATSLMRRDDLARDVRGLVLFQRALAKMYLQDYQGAAADYTAAIEIDPKFQAAHFGRAEAYTKLGDSAKAGQCYDLAAAAMPTDPLVYNNRGTYNVQLGRLTPAIADFSKALELEPKFAMAALNRGYAYSQKQAWSEAEADYNYSLEIDPQQTLALRLLGNARVAQGKLASAVETYSKAVTIDPEDSENYAGRGFARFFSQDFAKAAADFSKTLQLKPETTMVVPWKYVALVRSNQTDVAKQELQAFIKSLPKTPNWHVTVCQYLLGEINDEALLAMIKTTSDLKVQKQWLCEARFFQGVTATKPDVARSHYADCVKTQQIQLMAYVGAKLALSK